MCVQAQVYLASSVEPGDILCVLGSSRKGLVFQRENDRVCCDAQGTQGAFTELTWTHRSASDD